MVVRITIILLLITAAAFLSLLYYFYPAALNPYPGCMISRLTGFACPSCGSQRAFSALLTGDILLAAQYNILFLFFLLLIAFQFFRYIRHTFQRNPLPFQVSFTRIQLWIMLAVILVFWIGRNLI